MSSYSSSCCSSSSSSSTRAMINCDDDESELIRAPKGKKVAVVVGCNYPHLEISKQLFGCHNDARGMKELLVRHCAFAPDNVDLLVDQPGSLVMPTARNIITALNKMVHKAKPFDILFFFFSGHGSILRNRGNVRAIVPSDRNPIAGVADLRKVLSRLPKRAIFTMMSDSCFSGGLMEHEPEQIGPGHTSDVVGPEPEGGMISTIPKMIPVETLVEYFSTLTGLDSTDLGVHLLHHFGPEDCSLIFQNLPQSQLPKPLNKDQGILMSACQADELSYGARIDGKSRGAFTYAVQKTLKEKSWTISNKSLIVNARVVLKNKRIRDQHPCLHCSNKNADNPFLGARFFRED